MIDCQTFMEVQQNVFEVILPFGGEPSPSGGRRQARSERRGHPMLRRPKKRNSYSVNPIQEPAYPHDIYSTSAPASFAPVSKGKKEIGKARFYLPEFEVSDEISLNSDSMNNVQQAVSLTENLVTMRDELRFTLLNKHGLQRERILYKKHVKRSHYLLINAEEDNEKAAMVRALLEDRPDRPNIKGRWNIVLGSQRLADWEQLMQSATTVLVFLSKALCKDEILSLIFPSVFLQGRMTVPIYLEYFTHEEMEREFRSILRPVVYSYGITLHDRSIKRIKEDIDNLHAKTNFVLHYSKEIAALQDLVDRINSHNICPCGEC